MLHWMTTCAGTTSEARSSSARSAATQLDSRRNHSLNRRKFLLQFSNACLAGIGLSQDPCAARPVAGEPRTRITTGPSAPWAIRDAACFDVHTKVFVPHRTIWIEGERIAAVEDTARTGARRGKRVLEAKGRFLIPGLIDAHAHLTTVLYQAAMTGDEILPFFLANGVTTLRNTGDNVPAQKVIQRYSENHPDICPRIFLGSFLIGSAPPIHQDIGWTLSKPEDVPAFVAHMASWGVTTLKIYANCLPAVGRKVIEEGHRHGMGVTGHLSSYPASQAIDDGIDCLEHIESVSDFLRSDPRNRHSLDVTTDAAQRLVEKIARHKVFVDPTLMVFWGTLFFADDPQVINHPDNAGMPKRLLDFWAKDRVLRLSNYSSGTLSIRQSTFRKYQELVGMLHRAGVRILVGTDAPEPQVPPGLSLHHEMKLLVNSGMPPGEVLAAATWNNAKALRQKENLGSIAPGKLADLVLLEANPLENIENSRTVHRVVRGGRLLTPSQILKATSGV